MTQAPHIAYLVSQYPAVSHTFILREVRALRARGFAIDVASINAPGVADDGQTDEEREETKATFYVKRAGLAGAVKAHCATLCSHPIAYLEGLAYALSLGGLDLRKLVYALFYFVEAIMVGRWMKRRRLEHLHVHFATPASTVGLIAARAFPITLSITVHGPDEFYDAPGYRLAEKIAASSFVICIGLFAQSQLMKLSDASDWDKFEIAPLGLKQAQILSGN